MRLYSEIALALATALFLTACKNTVIGEGRNKPEAAPLMEANVPSRLQLPLPSAAPLAAELNRGATTEQAPPRVKLTPPAGIENRTRVAILLPLSGGRAELGRAVLDAAKLAFFELADSDFELRPYDTAATGQGAANAAERAVADGVKLVIGPIYSAAVLGAAPIVRNAGLNMLAFSNNRLVAEPGVYLSGLSPESQIERVISYAAQRGVRQLGVLTPRGAFGDRVLETARRAAGKARIAIVRSEKFGPATDDIARAVHTIGNYDVRRAALLKQKRALAKRQDEVSKRALARLKILDTLGPVSFDALVVATSGEDLLKMAAQLGNFDIDTKRVRLLGLASWAAEGTGREPALVGGWFATPPAARDNDFARNFRAIYEKEPHPLGANAYDLVALAAILSSQEGGAKYDKATLTSPTGFAGISGLFRFLPNGLSERGLEVREVTPGGSKMIDQALKNFKLREN